MDNIVLNELLNISEEDFENWTICLNNAHQGDDIYSFSEDKARLLQHISWKRPRNKNGIQMHNFRIIDKKYCLQFLRMDNQSHERWLFLGAYKVDERNPVHYFDDGHEEYNLILLEKYSHLVERLVIEYKKHPGDKQAKIDISNINKINVIEILNKPYIDITKKFDGYENVVLMFDDLKKIVNSSVESWKTSLSNVFGIYVVTDTKTGKLYVGSAYGKEGLWQRWSSYVYSNGTGGNKDLDLLIKEDENYSKNFQFSILEVMTNKKLPDKYIIDREKHWKEVLKSKEWGNNEN